MEKISILVLGLGRWGNEWLRIIDQNASVRLVGTAGGRRTSRTAQLPDAPHWTDFRVALRESDANATIIALPPHLHAEAIELSVAAGKDVLCEKPLVDKKADIARVIGALEENSTSIVRINQNYRYRSWPRAMRAAIEEGIIGDLHHLAVRFAQPEFLEGGRKELSNPLLDDMSIHHFDLIRYISGLDALKVHATQFRPAWTSYEGFPELEMLIQLENNVRVSYQGTWAATGEVTAWDGEWVAHGSTGVLRCVGGAFTLDSAFGHAAAPAPVADPATEVGPDLAIVLREFVEDVRTRRVPATGVADNRRSVAMQLAAAESIDRGGWASVMW